MACLRRTVKRLNCFFITSQYSENIPITSSLYIIRLKLQEYDIKEAVVTNEREDCCLHRHGRGGVSRGATSETEVNVLV